MTLGGRRLALGKAAELSTVWTTGRLCSSDQCGSLVLEDVEAAKGRWP